MDDELEKLVQLASERGSGYIKGATCADDIGMHTAELGVYLLFESKRLRDRSDEQLKAEINEIQTKIDDYRKALFNIRKKLL